MRQEGAGRPVRFFGLFLALWVGARLASLSGHGIPPDRVIAAAAPVRPALAIAIPETLPRPSRATFFVWKQPPFLRSRQFAPLLLPSSTQVSPAAAQDAGLPLDLMNFIVFSVAFANRHHASDMDISIAPLATPPPQPPAPIGKARPDRWAASAWLLRRGGSLSTPGAVAAGRLGGSQAGIRIDYGLVPSAALRPTAYARVASALDSPAAPEGAVGLSLQPVRALPIRFALERRIALGKGARNATTFMAVGGFGPRPVGGGVEAEGYVQAGMVGLRRRDFFIDGKLSLLAPVAVSTLRIGASMSGGAQPGAERLDLGPEVQLRLPFPHTHARLSLEWRERIAGRAAPSSGLALTLASDF